MPVFSSPDDQQSVFVTPPESSSQASVWQTGDGWVDLYAVLEIEPGASAGEVEDAILEQGSRLVGLAVSRGGNSERAAILRQLLPHCRAVLLDPALRSRYDGLLARHRRGERGLMTWDEFVAAHGYRPAGTHPGCLSVLTAAVLLAGAVRAVLA